MISKKLKKLQSLIGASALLTTTFVTANAWCDNCGNHCSSGCESGCSSGCYSACMNQCSSYPSYYGPVYA